MMATIRWFKRWPGPPPRPPPIYWLSTKPLTHFPRLLLLALLALTPAVAANPPSETLQLPGLTQPVEILQDHWGISHIYAKNEHDLFFAQGYNVARDRLFQLEIWRRQATGTVAEILGPRELNRDIGNRLFLFRGDLNQELNWYHPHGAAIVSAFVEGINAYIAETEHNPVLLKEFGPMPEELPPLRDGAHEGNETRQPLLDRASRRWCRPSPRARSLGSMIARCTKCATMFKMRNGIERLTRNEG